MSFNFNPLWKLLIDKGITKTELAKKSDVSSSTITRMGKNEYVALEVIDKICNYLDCEVEDVVKHLKDE